MPNLSAQIRTGLATFGLSIVVLALGGVFSRQGNGQPPIREITVGTTATRAYFAAEDCEKCHNESTVRPNAGGVKGPPARVRLDEFKTWNEQDKHRRAHDALTGDRGRKIGTLLGYKNVAIEPSCVTCHATGFLPDDPNLEPSLALQGIGQGVGCTACHGPYKEWVLNHGIGTQTILEWRSKPALEKKASFGMNDLRDPAERSRVCNSCHVGNSEERKVVSHAMYAAGHPPLPGIEINAFSRAMPPHWWKADEELVETKTTLIGGVVVLRDSMRLLATQALEGTKSQDKATTTRPDFAMYECYACHHELKPSGSRGWRQARPSANPADGFLLFGNRTGTPGRPRFRSWPLALARLALAEAEGMPDGNSLRMDFIERLAELNAAFDAKPFGDPGKVAGAANRLAEWSDAMLKTLQSPQFKLSAPPRLLAALTELRDDEFPDYDSARQIAWAITWIYGEWKPKPDNHSEFESILAEMDSTLKLDQYASRNDRFKRAVAHEGPEDGLRVALLGLSEDEYKTSVATAACYHPEAFRKSLARLSSLLPSRPPRER